MPGSLHLVTGGGGFIGSNIVERLVGRGERVRVLDDFSTGKRENLAPWLDRVELIEGDIRDHETVRGAMAGVDYVLHQAALPSVPRSIADPVSTHQVDADVESGAATETPADNGRWVYVVAADVAAGTTVRIAVTASDRPGGMGRVEAEKTV